MSIGTKLILLLTLTVGAVMFLASFLSLRLREAALETALRDELRAHAVTLQIALEENYANGQTIESRRLIDRLRENSRVYAVLLFDENGELTTISQPATNDVFRRLPEISDVLANGRTVETVREIESGKYLSIVQPLQLDAGRRGALEIVKPLALIESDIRRDRVNWLTTTLFLLAVIFAVVVVVLRRSLTKPFQELLQGAYALGRGDLEHRVAVPETRDELAFLAAEFNRMADNLTAQRRVAENEAENRLALARELRHSERLAAVGRLAAGVAHELGAPLNVIDARAEQLLENPATPPEKSARNLSIIRAQTARISSLVRQLLTLARPFDFRPVPIELGAHLAETLDQFEQNAARAGVVTEFPAAASEMTVTADREFLRQVWLNILQNALQAMPDGGKLRVERLLETRHERAYAAVRFADTGHGIAPEHRDKIFDPFYTTKDVGQGTGLGLAIAHRIVEEMDGFIEAENNPAGGATLTVGLPLVERENQ
ncbi:MAG: HAMP domain-containing protein [Acidobacteria bacterium]|nr:HAMP domain-containing protein [Acidobacteriota bacterium]